MTVLIKCHNCGSRIAIAVKRKIYLPPIFRVKCPNCGYEDVYSVSEAWEEDIYSFTCPVCKRRFFITRRPPLKIACPHCHSILYIASESDKPKIIRSRSPPPSAIPLGALIGGLLGFTTSKDKVEGAIAGGIIGALIGAVIDALTGFEKEAKYLD